MNVLILNVGSSSLKFRVFRMGRPRPLDQPEEVLVSGKVERMGQSDAQMTWAIGDDKASEAVGGESVSSAVALVLEHLGSVPIDSVGHRIVHGGPKFFQPVLVDEPVLADIHALTELAPLHNPSGLAGIETVRRLHPGIPNIAVFDTAFHHNLPAVAKTYALPNDLTKQLDLRRYGFHGISYSYVSKRLKMLVAPSSSRHIVCHLGNGASVCALLGGESVDTSMGFTPLEGLIMGTRSGDIDPGLLLHLQRTQGLTPDQVDDLLNNRSGLLGLSGASADVRDLEARTDAASNLALECFAYRVSKYVGAYASVLGGADALVFTGGIGQFSVGIRARVCARLEFLGMSIDEGRNRRATGHEPAQIGESRGKEVWLIPTEEELEIARQIFATRS